MRNRQHGAQLTTRHERHASYNQNSNTQPHNVSMKTRRGESVWMGNRRRQRRKGGGRKKGMHRRTEGGKERRRLGMQVRAPETTPLTHPPTNQHPNNQPTDQSQAIAITVTTSRQLVQRSPRTPRSTDIHHSPPNNAAPCNIGFKLGGHILLWK